MPDTISSKHMSCDSSSPQSAVAVSCYGANQGTRNDAVRLLLTEILTPGTNLHREH